MEFVRKNKYTIIVIAAFLIIVLILVQVKNIFFPNVGKAVYGDRLDGIEKVKITSSEKSEVKEKLEDDSSVKKVKTEIHGRLVNIIITVNDEVAIDTAKSLADKAIEPFDEEQKKYYDFQIFVKKENDATDFPIIGYRHHNKEAFSWTKDRAGS